MSEEMEEVVRDMAATLTLAARDAGLEPFGVPGEVYDALTAWVGQLDPAGTAERASAADERAWRRDRGVGRG